MRTMTYSESRARYAETLDAVVDDREEVIITRAGGREPVIMMALSEYESMMETAHLLRSPANARRILAAIKELEHGGGEVHDLIDPDDSSAGATPPPGGELHAELYAAVSAVRAVEGLPAVAASDPAVIAATRDPKVLRVVAAIKRYVDDRSRPSSPDEEEVVIVDVEPGAARR